MYVRVCVWGAQKFNSKIKRQRRNCTKKIVTKLEMNDFHYDSNCNECCCCCGYQRFMIYLQSFKFLIFLFLFFFNFKLILKKILFKKFHLQFIVILFRTLFLKHQRLYEISTPVVRIVFLCAPRM